MAPNIVDRKSVYVVRARITKAGIGGGGFRA